MRVLITGGTGFVGMHLARACAEAKDEVFVTSRVPRAGAIACDVRDEAQVLAAVEQVGPDRVFHLAGLASAARSFDADAAFIQTNVLGTVNVLRAVKAKAPAARVLYVGSAEEYGRVPLEEQPIRESAPLRPVSPYGVSRAAASLVAQRFALAEGLHVVRTRSFNHTGPGHAPEFVAPSFAEQLVRARRRGQDSVEVLTGDVSVRRDFSGVSGVVRVYRALLEKAPPGEVVNVCAGRAVAIHDLLVRLGEIAGVTPVARPDPARARRADLPVVVGSPFRMTELTGISLAASLDPDLVALVRATEERLA